MSSGGRLLFLTENITRLWIKSGIKSQKVLKYTKSDLYNQAKKSYDSF